MTFTEKHFVVKIYDSLGTTFKTTLRPNELKNEISFTSRINGGQGQLVLDLQRDFDDFDEGDEIDFMNVVRVYEVDENNPSGRLIYSGFISAYKPYVRGSDQGVEVVCLGLCSLLSLAFYKDADYTVSKSSVDPKAIFEDIIDHFNTVYSGTLIDYSGSVVTVGTNVSYEYVKRKWREAIDDTLLLSGAGYYWYVDQDGLFTFAQNPATSTHTFTLQKDVEEFLTNKSSEEIVNKTRVFYNGGTSDDSDATSISEYGTREETITDSNITDLTTASQRAAQAVDDNKDVKINASLKINSLYDIETIKPGDTCKIRNIKSGQATFTDNMQIYSVKYTPDFVILELAQINNNFGIQINEFVNPIQ